MKKVAPLASLKVILFHKKWGAKSDVNGKRMDFHLSGGNNGMLVLLFLDVQVGDLFWLAITT